MLPTEAMGGAWRFLVMLSFTRPSPNTLIVNGLPVCTQHLTSVLKGQAERRRSRWRPRTGDVLVSKLDVGDVISWFSGTVGNFTRSVFHILTVYVHFTRTLNGQTEAPVTWGTIQTHFRISRIFYSIQHLKPEELLVLL